MNAFENIVSRYLEEEGYWVRQSVKVNILKDDKKKIGLPSMPRPEIDIVALNVKDNELLLIECKSLLDSYGVNYYAISGEDADEAKRYKLFTNQNFRKIVSTRLKEEYLNQGLIRPNTKMNYGLAAGRIHTGQEKDIAQYFSKRGWKLFTPKLIAEKMRQLSDKGWEDDLVTMTAKLILRMSQE